MTSITNLQKAIKFATKTHEVYQKQKRKGTDISYITHPLAVGLILSSVGASEDVVLAGILHDTIEDSIDEKKVTFEMLEERFGKNVAALVLAVTETDKNLPWAVRKREAIEHIKTFSPDTVLLKSADVVHNNSEILDGYNRIGDDIWKRFQAPKSEKIKVSIETLQALIDRWPKNPLRGDLKKLKIEFENLK